ncbi:MAG: DNA repair protein RecO [Gammaproteobacteria bacterium]|nr:DNA repair protein RecO [Gammaproteobacteria bacterium]
MTRVTDEPALVLHTMPYRESSLIATLLTLHHGRVAALARGVRKTRRGHSLQALARLKTGWSGRSSLVTLTHFESTSQAWLKGDAMAAGFYITELINRLVQERESLPRLFAGACWAIDRLDDGATDLEEVLRSFEKLLLDELGYGLDFSHDAQTGLAIDKSCNYRLEAEQGFIHTPESESSAGFEQIVYPGSALLDIAAGNFSSRSSRKAGKRIFRECLAPHLGAKPLTSRRLLAKNQISDGMRR